MYHRVRDVRTTRCDPSTISATPADFEWQMRRLARHHRVVSVEDVLHAVRGGRPLPARATLITFDDGCRDFADVAWPTLRRLGLPVTLFVPTAFPGRPGLPFWWDRLAAAFLETARMELQTDEVGPLSLRTDEDRRASLRRVQQVVKSRPEDEAMALVERLCGALDAGEPPQSDVLTWDALRELARDGVTVAAHTRAHAGLTRVPPDRARVEIRGALDDLRRELGSVAPIFSYPFGQYDDRVVAMVRDAGFEVAVTCEPGLNTPGACDPLRLRRTNITRRTTRSVFALRLTALGAYVDVWRHRNVERPAWSQASLPAPPDPSAAPGGRPLTVAYITSRFPKVSETFVLNEMRALAALGTRVEFFPLLRTRQRVRHAEVAEWMARAHFEPFMSMRILSAHARVLRRQPVTYVRVLCDVLRRTWRSPNFFIGAIGIFPKAVRFACDMRDLGVDHVHAHFATHPAVAAYVVQRLTGIPFSFTAHGSDLHVDRRMLDAKVEAAAFAVTISDFNREVMVRECGEHARHTIHVIHCGVDPHFFSPGAGRRERGVFDVVCVASLEEVKGHRFLIDACGVLRDRGVAFRCHLVGDGPRRRAIADHIERLALSDQVHLHGPLPRADVARLLSGADAAVLASHPTPDGKREGIPVALMEAMSSGLPVVATRISGIPELVAPGTGLLVPSGDVLALADALEHLANEPEARERLGRAARAQVLRSFSLNTNTAELLRLFVRHASGRRDLPTVATNKAPDGALPHVPQSVTAAPLPDSPPPAHGASHA
jgi:colanic acid/amylovoran biosynthesis glycosyltransferase